jgi:hypothetical protein
MNMAMQVGVVRFWLANHWTNAALADTSPVSHFSHDPQSIFFGNLVAQNPYLLDHMLYANEGQLAHMKVSRIFVHVVLQNHC